MHRLHRSSLLVALLIGFAATPARAECWAVYDDAYRSFYKSVSGISLPSRAGHFSSMGECQSFISRMKSDPQYRGDSGLQRTQCGCDDGSSGGAAMSGGGSFQQQIVTAAVSSLLNALLSGLNAPPGPTGEEVRQQLQKQWDEEEAARKLAEKKRLDAVFAHAHQTATALLGNRPAGAGSNITPPEVGDGAVTIGYGKMPALLRSSGVVTEVEWAEARQWQSRIDELRAKVTLNNDEARELAALEAKRNALWMRATATPGLTQRERVALQLKLHRIDEGAASASADELIQMREQTQPSLGKNSLAILSTMTESSITYGLQAGIEMLGEDAADNLISKGGRILKFGDAYFIGGAAVAVANGKPEEAAGSGVGWLIGKIASKAPSLSAGTGTAQGVAAVTVATFKASLDTLLVETDKVLPGFLPEGGAPAWREEMKEKSTRGQKFVYEGLGF